MTLDRRRFLTSLPLLGTTAGRLLADVPGGYQAEAQRLTDLLQRTFWDPIARQYRAPVRSAESVDSDPAHNNGYVLWPSVEALHALAEGASMMTRRYAPVIHEVVAGLEQYFDPEKHAYNAWLTFPGNNDKYYDDNALMVIALAKAYQYTGERTHRDRAAEVMEGFLRGGWDASGNPGGMQWGTDPRNPATADRAACSTSMTALAALWLARLGIDRQAHVAFASTLLEWLLANLQDADGLIMDALEPPDWRVRRVKWTYNTGVALRAHVELYRLTGEASALAQASRLALAAVTRDGAMYDSLVENREQRFFYDSSFFVPYLVDGLVGLYEVSREPTILGEAERNAGYAYEYLRDPDDGLYFRNWRLWRIGDEQLATWQALMGQTHALEPDDSERSNEPRYDNIPLADRPLVKTLLANAGMARLLWVLARARGG
ncbi:MAG: hypothetical protein FJX75_19555 [Armatimonadetes bacterium]|nr:hypothetical protein [Armatimonadota bacterium]